jgi:hypothetical protein
LQQFPLLRGERFVSNGNRLSNGWIRLLPIPFAKNLDNEFVPNVICDPLTVTPRVTAIHDEQKERWLELCELAAKEQNSDKLLQYVQEINLILEEKQKRLSRPKN